MWVIALHCGYSLYFATAAPHVSVSGIIALESCSLAFFARYEPRPKKPLSFEHIRYHSTTRLQHCGRGSQCLVCSKNTEGQEWHMNVMAAWLMTVTCLVVAVTCQICTRSIELKFEEGVLRKLICDQPLRGYESNVLQ